jgi:hypothetical protein
VTKAKQEQLGLRAQLGQRDQQEQQAQLDRQDPLEQRALRVLRDREALGCHSKATFQLDILHSCHHPLMTVSPIILTTDW